ncbi:MAG: AMP-binding protein, partial [Clostridia bacterium]|nr:AMP-binding protein [Clostridia bacterium]
MPVERMTLGQLLDRAASLFGDRDAYVFQGRRLSYRQLRDEVELLARGLIGLGVEKGEKISLWLPNSLEWVYAYFAAAKIGAVLVPVNTRFKKDEAGYVIRQSDSSVLLFADRFRNIDYLEMVEALRAEGLPQVRHLVVKGQRRPEGAVGFEEVVALGRQVPVEALRQREASVDPDDLVLLVYTSGTTGFPKGAMHSHKIIRNMADAAERMKLGPDDKVVLYMPLFHVYGCFAGVLCFMYAGGCIVLMELFDAEESLRLMERERATIVYGMDTMYHDQMRLPNFAQFDLRSLRFGLCPGTGDFVRRVRRAFCPVSNVYGMTETTSITSFSFLDDPEEKVADTQGYPLPGFQCKVVDPQSGATLPPGTTGELCVRGHPVMLGYYKKPEETAKVLEPDGWFHTGDAAQLTPDGYIRLAGRIKEMYRVGGENVDPVEVEVVLARHPAVSMAKVLGVPDQRLGEVGMAFIQLKAG